MKKRTWHYWVEVGDEKIWHQNDSWGIGSAERLWLPKNKHKYTLKIWAESYVENVNTTNIQILKSNNITPFSTDISPELLKKDLDLFRKIRELANAGMYKYRSKSWMDSLYREDFYTPFI